MLADPVRIKDLFLAALDGGIDPEWVPDNAVEPAGE